MTLSQLEVLRSVGFYFYILNDLTFILLRRKHLLYTKLAFYYSIVSCHVYYSVTLECKCVRSIYLSGKSKNFSVIRLSTSILYFWPLEFCVCITRCYISTNKSIFMFFRFQFRICYFIYLLFFLSVVRVHL